MGAAAAAKLIGSIGANANLQGNFGGSAASSSNGGYNTARNWVNGTEASIRNQQSAYERMLYQDRSWEDTAKYNSQEAAIARQWEEYMSNTAYQRAMLDMRKAGLNPILAYSQGGASTPSAQIASMAPMSGAQANAVADSYGESEGSTWGSSTQNSWFDNNVHALANSTAGAIGNLIGSDVGQGIYNAITGGKDWIQDKAGNLGNWVNGVVKSAKDVYKKLDNALSSVANNKNKYYK